MVCPGYHKAESVFGKNRNYECPNSDWRSLNSKGGPNSYFDSETNDLEEYITYNDGTDTRYELRDGVLVAVGAESDANVNIAMFLY